MRFAERRISLKQMGLVGAAFALLGAIAFIPESALAETAESLNPSSEIARLELTDGVEAVASSNESGVSETGGNGNDAPASEEEQSKDGADGETTETPVKPAITVAPGLHAVGDRFQYGNPDGSPLTSSWKTINGKRYYFDADGKSVRWEQLIDGKWYYFNGQSQMQTGWVTWKNDSTKSYFGSDGAALTGWQTINGKRYYFNPATGRSLRWEQSIGGKWYYFNGQSQMQTGWVTWKNDGSKSYFGSNGTALTGWQTIGGKRYYFSPSTARSVRWEQNINGFWYYFNGQSQMHTGLLTWKADGLKSVYGSDGKRLTGWQKAGGHTYYIDPATGKSVRWEQQIGGKWYYFNGNSQMHTGWLKWNGKELWSYYWSDGTRASGTHTIDGHSYTFDTNGMTKTKPIILPAGQLAMNQKAQGYTSSTNYLILVNSSTHKVGIYHRESGRWECIGYWDCTTGAKNSPTKKGSFTVGIKMKSFGSGFTCWYATQFSGNYLFHSIKYQPGSMSRVQDGRLGVSASHGCVRLDIQKAKWIYQYIPRGTRVISY